MSDKPRTAKLVELVQSVVKAQGNIYIRELLREKGIPRGANKEEFERNLLEAARTGQLTLAGVEDWLARTEAWGNQHIYAYRVSKRLLNLRDWTSEADLRKSLPPSQAKLWKAGEKLTFPDTLALAEIAPEAGGGIRYVWREGATMWQRDRTQDDTKTVDGDLYEMRAYRQQRDRTVHRFVLRADLGLACVFLQGEFETAAHTRFLKEVERALAAIAPFSDLDPLNLSTVIRNVDQGELDQTQVQVKAQKTRLSDAGAYVEFATTTADGRYMDSEPVRHIRRAATQEKGMTGANGTFEYGTRTPTGLARPVRFDLFAGERRIKLRAQMQAADVWSLLQFLDANGGKRVATAGGG